MIIQPSTRTYVCHGIQRNTSQEFELFCLNYMLCINSDLPLWQGVSTLMDTWTLVNDIIFPQSTASTLNSYKA